MKLVAKQVYESPRHNFLSMCPRLNLIWLFIFVGETGADCWDTLHKCAYSLCGKPVRSKKLFSRGEHLSTLGAMSTSGVLDSEVVRSAVDADDFYDFIHSSLLPNSCLLMGLVPIVSSSWIIVQLIKCKKLLLPLSWSTCNIYLPHYSPDLTPPIEELFYFSEVVLNMKVLEGGHQIDPGNIYTSCIFNIL